MMMQGSQAFTLVLACLLFVVSLQGNHLWLKGESGTTRCHQV